MKKRSTIDVAGFEYLPEGQLLTQFVDFRHPLAVAYERCVGYTKDFHIHDRVNLTFPRGSSVIEFKTKAPDATFRVDETKFLWMPKNVIHRQDTISTIYDNLAIFPNDESVAQAVRDFEQKYGKIISEPKMSLLKRKTPLLDTLVQQYFTERILERKKAALVRGLTFQILEEILRTLFCPKQSGLNEETPADLENSTVRAIRYIEGNLFGSIDSISIAKVARVSVPTLFRKFKSDLGMTPRDYILKRRMDEAKNLLSRGEHKVGDIALLVGYEDIAAFSKAFKSLTGKSPKEFLKAR